MPDLSLASDNRSDRPLMPTIQHRSLLGLSLVSLLLSSAQVANAAEGALDFSLVAQQPVDEPASPLDRAVVQNDAARSQAPPSLPSASNTLVLSFDPPLAPHPPKDTPRLPYPIDPQAALFEGDTHSLVAKAIGSAEGTRTPEGGKTAAYYGHRDPGNGAWNLGSFSYQHGAQSPEEADTQQLHCLHDQAQVLRQQAEQHHLQLTIEEELNGIDLANQAPAAALDRGYIDWLQQAHELGMTGAEAILWARTRSFLDPDSGRWNAPGLGNTVAQITHDQERRMQAIARAITAHRQRPPATVSVSDRVSEAILFQNPLGSQ